MRKPGFVLVVLALVSVCMILPLDLYSHRCLQPDELVAIYKRAKWILPGGNDLSKLQFKSGKYLLLSNFRRNVSSTLYQAANPFPAPPKQCSDCPTTTQTQITYDVFEYLCGCICDSTHIHRDPSSDPEHFGNLSDACLACARYDEETKLWVCRHPRDVYVITKPSLSKPRLEIVGLVTLSFSEKVLEGRPSVIAAITVDSLKSLREPYDSLRQSIYEYLQSVIEEQQDWENTQRFVSSLGEKRKHKSSEDAQLYLLPQDRVAIVNELINPAPTLRQESDTCHCFSKLRIDSVMSSVKPSDDIDVLFKRLSLSSSKMLKEECGCLAYARYVYAKMQWEHNKSKAIIVGVRKTKQKSTNDIFMFTSQKPVQKVEDFQRARDVFIKRNLLEKTASTITPYANLYLYLKAFVVEQDSVVRHSTKTR